MRYYLKHTFRAFFFGTDEQLDRIEAHNATITTKVYTFLAKGGTAWQTTKSEVRIFHPCPRHPGITATYYTRYNDNIKPSTHYDNISRDNIDNHLLPGFVNILLD